MRWKAMSRGKWVIFFFAALVLLSGGRLLFSSGNVHSLIDLSDNEKRVAYLARWGWQVEPEPCQVETIRIPADFCGIYESYNQLQRAQGFDLKPYAGKEVTRFCYIVTNYPNYPEDIRANLLISEAKLIGGEIFGLFEGGFLHGFSEKS